MKVRARPDGQTNRGHNHISTMFEVLKLDILFVYFHKFLSLCIFSIISCNTQIERNFSLFIKLKIIKKSCCLTKNAISYLIFC